MWAQMHHVLPNTQQFGYVLLEIDWIVLCFSCVCLQICTVRQSHNKIIEVCIFHRDAHERRGRHLVESQVLSKMATIS